MSGAVCSTAPATRRPRGPRNDRPVPLTNPKVTRGPCPFGLPRATTGAADAGGLALGERERGRALGGCLQDGQVAIGVDADDGRIGAASIGEGDGQLVAVQVVGVGQDPVLADHHAGAAAPSVADADHRWSNALRDLADLPAQVCQGCHVVVLPPQGRM